MSKFKMYVRPDCDQPGLWLWVVYKDNRSHDGCDASFKTRREAVIDALDHLDEDMVLEVEVEEMPAVKVVDEQDDRDQSSPYEFSESMNWDKYNFDDDTEWF